MTAMPPNLQWGDIPTAAQWNRMFTGFQRDLGFAPLNSAGGNMSGRLLLGVPNSIGASLNFPAGTTPGVLEEGDTWATSNGLFYYYNGHPVSLLWNVSCVPIYTPFSIDGGVYTLRFDFAAGYNFTAPLNVGNNDIGDPLNPHAGQTGRITLTQPGTGTGTVTFSANWHFPAGPIGLTATPGASDEFIYYVQDVGPPPYISLIPAVGGIDANTVDTIVSDAIAALGGPFLPLSGGTMNLIDGTTPGPRLTINLSATAGSGGGLLATNASTNINSSAISVNNTGTGRGITITNPGSGNSLLIQGGTANVLAVASNGTISVGTPTGPTITGQGNINISGGLFINGAPLLTGALAFLPLAGGHVTGAVQIDGLLTCSNIADGGGGTINLGQNVAVGVPTALPGETWDAGNWDGPGVSWDVGLAGSGNVNIAGDYYRNGVALDFLMGGISNPTTPGNFLRTGAGTWVPGVPVDANGDAWVPRDAYARKLIASALVQADGFQAITQGPVRPMFQFAGDAPTGVLANHFQMTNDGTVTLSTHAVDSFLTALGIGGLAAVTAPNVNLNPDISSWGNVQVGLSSLNTSVSTLNTTVNTLNTTVSALSIATAADMRTPVLGKVISTTSLHDAIVYVDGGNASGTVTPNFTTFINISYNLIGNLTLGFPSDVSNLQGRSGIMRFYMQAASTISYGAGYIYERMVAPSILTTVATQTFFSYTVFANHIVLTLLGTGMAN